MKNQVETKAIDIYFSSFPEQSAIVFTTQEWFQDYNLETIDYRLAGQRLPRGVVPISVVAQNNQNMFLKTSLCNNSEDLKIRIHRYCEFENKNVLLYEV